MNNQTKHVPGWIKIFLAMKEKGFQDIECCQKAGVSLEKFKTYKNVDTEFRRAYDKASQSRAQPLKW